ncbi:MAG: hypothetical protein VYA32_03275 [Planctomycetota bacterium]|nr:hypothetical protein [Planctomycetota bacterium]
MIRRLLGAVGLVLLVWGVGEIVVFRVTSARGRIERQVDDVTELYQRRDGLRDEVRRLGAPDRMLPPVTANGETAGEVR